MGEKGDGSGWCLCLIVDVPNVELMVELVVVVVVADGQPLRVLLRLKKNSFERKELIVKVVVMVNLINATDQAELVPSETAFI